MNKPFFFWSNISFSLKSTLNERKGILFVVRKTVSQDFSIQAQFVLHKKENLPSFHSQQVSFSMSQSIKKAAVTFGITVIRKFMWTNQNCHRVGEGRFSWRKKVQENHTIYSTSRSNCLSGPTFSAFGNDIWYCVLKFLGLQDFSRMVLRKWDLNLILDFFDFLNFVQLFSRTHCSQSPPAPTKKNPTRTCDLFRLSVFKIRCTASDLTTFWSVLRKKEQTGGVRWAEGLFKNFRISPPLLLLLVMMVVVGDAPTCSLSETQKPNPKKARSWTNLTPFSDDLAGVQG